MLNDNGNTLQKSSQTKDILIIGLALFAMFFGSGNLIFPPDIGITDGTQWGLGFFFYFFADAGLALLGVIAINHSGGKMEQVMNLAGKAPGTLITIAVILSIGPGLAIPRNGAVTLEMGIAPAFGLDASSPVVRAVFSIVFFGLVCLLTVRPSRVVDVVGKYMTPILVIALIILIVIGVVSPQAASQPSVSDTVIKDGIFNGYQTLDLMAALFFSLIIIDSAKDRGYSTEGARTAIVLKAGVISCLLLMLVYGGLAYLGSTTGMLWREEFLAGDINQAALLMNIAHQLMGRVGAFVLALIVAFACMTTAIGLTSAAGTYFSELSRGRVGYAAVVVIVCVVSALFCNVGLSQIISITAPILMICYPVTVLTVIESFLTGRFQNRNAYILSAAVTFLISLGTILCDSFGMNAFAFLHQIPLDQFGFNWIIPAAAAFLIGSVIPGRKIGA